MQSVPRNPVCCIRVMRGTATRLRAAAATRSTRREDAQATCPTARGPPDTAMRSYSRHQYLLDALTQPCRCHAKCDARHALGVAATPACVKCRRCISRNLALALCAPPLGINAPLTANDAGKGCVQPAHTPTTGPLAGAASRVARADRVAASRGAGFIRDPAAEGMGMHVTLWLCHPRPKPHTRHCRCHRLRCRSHSPL